MRKAPFIIPIAKPQLVLMMFGFEFTRSTFVIVAAVVCLQTLRESQAGAYSLERNKASEFTYKSKKEIPYSAQIQ